MRVGEEVKKVKKVSTEWREGGCHCGAVRIRVRSSSSQVVSCNCSMCRKRADLQLIVDARDFEVLCGESKLALYQFNTRIAQHRFCRVCGIPPFNMPRSNSDCVAVNVRCLDQPQRGGWSIETFDGENWEQSIDQLRSLQASSRSVI